MIWKLIEPLEKMTLVERWIYLLSDDDSKTSDEAFDELLNMENDEVDELLKFWAEDDYFAGRDSAKELLILRRER